MHHLFRVLQVVLGVLQVQGNLGNQEFLCLLVDLGCLDLEGQGLLFLHLLQGILAVPLGLEVQGGQGDRRYQTKRVQVAHEVQVHQVYQAHLLILELHQIQISLVYQGLQGNQDLLLVQGNL